MYAFKRLETFSSEHEGMNALAYLVEIRGSYSFQYVYPARRLLELEST